MILLAMEPEEERDLQKFLRFLGRKVVQIIVQSRLGEKVHTKSKPQSVGYDWFNLAITDIPEVLSETKKVMGDKVPSKDMPMCIEISLNTCEGETMVLETWCLGMNDKYDGNAKVRYTVYNRMGLLLKSLISVTRVTPAYRLARKQGTDFILCYRIYFGDAQVSQLGENFQTTYVGSVGTPRGTVTLSAAFRTKLALPQRDTGAQVSERMSKNLARRLSQDDGPVPCVGGMQVPIAMPTEFRLRIAEEIAQAAAEDFTASTTSPSMFYPPSPHSGDTLTPPGATPPSNNSSQASVRQEVSSSPNIPEDVFSKNCTAGAFVPSRTNDLPSFPELSSTPPFATLLPRSNDPSSQGSSLASGSDKSSSKESSKKLEESDSNPKSPNEESLSMDDFILVELKPVFSTSTSTGGDLGQFYRECQAAPPLDLFTEGQSDSFEQFVEQLDGEFSKFQENIFEFDEFVKCLDER